MAACGTGNLAVPTVSTTRTTGGSLPLTHLDNGTTKRVSVPGQVTVDLPYEKSTGDVWQLAGGGPGFAQAGASQFTSNPGQSGQDLQVLRFTVVKAGTFSLLLDLAPTGPLTKPPAAQFRVTLRAG